MVYTFEQIDNLYFCLRTGKENLDGEYIHHVQNVYQEIQVFQKLQIAIYQSIMQTEDLAVPLFNN